MALFSRRSFGREVKVSSSRLGALAGEFGSYAARHAGHRGRPAQPPLLARAASRCLRKLSAQLLRMKSAAWVFVTLLATCPPNC